MQKKAVLITVFLLLFALPALAAPPDGSLRALDAKTWPAKAAWPGQTASFFPAKFYASASYLLVFSQPGQTIAGVDQLFFTRTLTGKTFTVQGLYELKKRPAAPPEYYWRLDGPPGTAPVWVKDYPEGQLSTLPFALASEIAEEEKQRAAIAALVGKVVWLDRNRVAGSELSASVDHLAPLTITGFKSAGPFSETYALSFAQASGEPLIWQLGPTGSRTAYSHSQFLLIFGQAFRSQDPVSLFPKWPPSVWDAIKMREIKVGMEKDMVLLSWGETDKREKIEAGPEKGLERWRYPEGYRLYFKGKELVKIKMPRPVDLSKNQPEKPADKTAKDLKDADKPGKDNKDDGFIDVPVAAKEKKATNTKEAD